MTTHVGGKKVAKNAMFILFGQIIPLAVGLYCIPHLIHLLGAERFGFLSLIWVIVGYLSIFDLGLGQALTKLVAEKIGHAKHDEIPPLFWTTIWLLCGLGVIALIVTELSTPFLMGHVFNLSGAFKQEAQSALYIAFLSLPFIIVSTGTRGVLEAHQRYNLINRVSIPLGIYTFAAPLLVAQYWSTNLSAIATALVMGRFIFLIGIAWLCLSTLPELKSIRKTQRMLLPELFRFGGWMTITNLVGPMMVYLDRFVIGAMVSMAAVAYYVTPYEVVTKLWILPTAISSAMLTALAINFSKNPAQAARLFGNAMNGIFLIMLPITICVMFFAQTGLTIWLGYEFASHTVLIFQLLAIGVFINSFGRIPYVFFQSAGRPDIPARLFLIELPIYVLLLWYALKTWEVEGVAIAWIARIVLDNIVLLIAARRIMPQLASDMWKGIAMTVLPCLFLPWIIVIHGERTSIALITFTLLVMIVGLIWFKRNWTGKLSKQTETSNA